MWVWVGAGHSGAVRDSTVLCHRPGALALFAPGVKSQPWHCLELTRLPIFGQVLALLRGLQRGSEDRRTPLSRLRRALQNTETQQKFVRSAQGWHCVARVALCPGRGAGGQGWEGRR